ncbi:serine protease [Cymbomonas tetramitiformis]|uniref:Serine protease n=1 Tax=Cymbomonas tetramitiformis TaxID=36881 RepID=A0AAE0FUB5_9CHLO|nr:serine protease [Cymbomonas tetramitiformis]
MAGAGEGEGLGCEVRMLEVELEPVPLAKASSFGLSERWISALAQRDSVRRQVLRVQGRVCGSCAAEVFQDGDMLLAAGGRPITCFQDVEQCVAECSTAELPVTLWRHGEELSVQLTLSHESCQGTGRIVHWAGMQVQSTHRPVKEKGFLPAGGGVFISRWHHGSPAHRYQLWRWITSA